MSFSGLTLVVILLQSTNQESVQGSEKWALVSKFNVGESQKLDWTTKVNAETLLDERKADEVDYIQETSAMLKILEVKTDGTAVGQILNTLISWKGLIGKGRQFDLLIEEGEIKRPPAPHGSKLTAIVASWLKPIDIRISPLGKVEVDLKHPWVSVLGGFGSSFGPLLPQNAVGVGDSWEGVFHGDKNKVPKEPDFTFKYLLSEIVQKNDRREARITYDTKQSYECDGLSCTFAMRGEAFFGLQESKCNHTKSWTEYSGSGKSGNQTQEVKGKVVQEFEMSSAK